MSIKKVCTKQKKQKQLIGRHEWCLLPDLPLPPIKAKIDTGAKTSALHAFHIKIIDKNGVDHVSFDIHPIQGDSHTTQSCVYPLHSECHVRSSNGIKEHRYAIKTHLTLGDKTWPIKLTLSNRDPLRYRMLLGREALNGEVIIDPALSCHLGNNP